MIERQGKTVKEDRKEMKEVRDSDNSGHRQRTEQAKGRRQSRRKESGERVRQQTDPQEPRSPEACCEPALSLQGAPTPSPNPGGSREGLYRLLPRVIGTPSRRCWSLSNRCPGASRVLQEYIS